MSRKVVQKPLVGRSRLMVKALGDIQETPIPQGQDLLRLVVRCLLQRMKRLSPKEGNWAAKVVQVLAAHERAIPPILRSAFKLPPEGHERALAQLTIKDQRVSRLLRWLADGQATRQDHWPEALRLQRDVMTQYLETAPFPCRGNNLSVSRGKWWDDHGEKLWARLAAIPCLCSYTTGNRKTLREDLRDCTNVAPMTHAFLACLHHPTTPEQVRRLLKPSKNQP